MKKGVFVSARLLGAPILKNDPTGLAASPVYDVRGNLLGTDDQGLQGKPIIMKAENFTQGMSHKEATKHDLAPNGGAQYQEVISDQANYAKFYQHFTNLPNRPDYDGYLTKEEADEWWRNGNGEPLYVDRIKIVLDPATTSWF